jgi:hypothetical protein
MNKWLITSIFCILVFVYILVENLFFPAKNAEFVFFPIII